MQISKVPVIMHYKMLALAVKLGSVIRDIYRVQLKK